MICIDEHKIFEIIRERNPKVVAFNGPEGIMRKIQEVADKVSNEFGITAYVIGDACYGSCDINLHAAEIVGANILFHIGHSVSMEYFGNRVVLIDAFDDINFSSVAQKCARELKNYRTLSIVTDSQHLPQLQSVKEILETHGFNVLIGKGRGQLNDGQVFGCEFYPTSEVKDLTDAYLFLGQSSFHAAGVALSSGKPTYILDPYNDEIKDVTKFALELQKKSILTIYRALDANTIGLVVGLKEGQIMLNHVLELKKELEKHNKKVRLIALTEVTNERLMVFGDIDAFIQVACPRISIDNSFTKPVLSVPQAHGLIRLLNKESLDDFLKVPHWL
ncbi:MAG: diphthamide biosynthesis enzyme Dph2 [Nitrososphaerales archaeon]